MSTLKEKVAALKQWQWLCKGCHATNPSKEEQCLLCVGTAYIPCQRKEPWSTSNAMRQTYAGPKAKADQSVNRNWVQWGSGSQNNYKKAYMEAVNRNQQMIKELTEVKEAAIKAAKR